MEPTITASPKLEDASTASTVVEAAALPQLDASIPRITEGEYTFIRMPSDNLKMVIVKKDSQVNMGKFGTFKMNEIIGEAYGYSYEVLTKGKVRKVSNVEEVGEDEWDGTNNQDICQQTNAQTMTQEEIEILKRQSLTDDTVNTSSIVQSIAQAHTAFDKKTGFSKAKYMARKRQKFGKIFTPLLPSLRNVHDYFFTKNPTKIMDVRMDTLSQALTMLNAHAGSRILVVDDAQGMFISGILERLGGLGQVVGVHSGEHPNYDVNRYMNFSKEMLAPLRTISWARLLHPEDDALLEDLQERIPVGEGKGWSEAERKEREVIVAERRRRRQEALRSLRETMEAGQFDGLFIATAMDSKDVLQRLLPYVAGSRPVVLYSGFKESLLPAYAHEKQSTEFLNPTMYEPWLRAYQVLPGRTHPMMSTTGGGGYLLSATKVIDCDVEAVGIIKQRGKAPRPQVNVLEEETPVAGEKRDGEEIEGEASKKARAD